MRTAFRRAAVLAGAGLVLAAPALAGCGKSSSGANPAPASTEPVTLTINLFGDFDYKPLYEKYRQSHPNVTVKENITDYDAHHKNLKQHLTAGAGLADVEVIEIGQVAGYQGQASKFVNFLEQGVDAATWTDQRVKDASSADGKILFGLGTDTGGLALCYRPSLVKKAGLPTDPTELSARMKTWDDFIALGKDFQNKIGDKTTRWFDAASNVFNAILAQAPQALYDASGNVIAATNPDVKKAWDQTVAGIQAGESAGLAAFTPQWNTGFQKAGFATITCPSWMMGYIKSNAPDTKGDWNVAPIPGTGGGNWGGSYLTVPKTGKHIAQSVELVKWLTAPEQQAELFKTKGHFPSAQALWKTDDIVNFKDDFFSNAPVGKIFAESAENIKYQPLGAHAGEFGNAIGNALVSVEQGKAAPDAAWQKALADIRNIAA
jgi:cellobiose transport system substrate-binding protein